MTWRNMEIKEGVIRQSRWLLRSNNGTLLTQGKGGVLQISSDGDDQRIFWDRKIWQVSFWVAWFFFWGTFKTIWIIIITLDGMMNKKHKHLISNVFKFRVISLNAFWKFLMFGNGAWDFFGVNFWCRDFLGFCLKAYGYLGVLVFAPIRSFPSLEIQSTPLPRPRDFLAFQHASWLLVSIFLIWLPLNFPPFY